MKKLIIAAIMSVATFSVFAQEKSQEAAAAGEQSRQSSEIVVWPAFFAVCEYPASTDVIGLRLTIPYATKQDNVTGFDVGLWGRSTYFEGVQVNLLRNDVKDAFCGVQLGIYNSVGHGQMNGFQIGLWNEAISVHGLQCSLVNVAGDVEGFQVGLINRCESMHGFQVGVINVIRSAEMKFCPLVNIGF